jgi:hypothetical protein
MGMGVRVGVADGVAVAGAVGDTNGFGAFVETSKTVGASVAGTFGAGVTLEVAQPKHSINTISVNAHLCITLVILTTTLRVQKNPRVWVRAANSPYAITAALVLPLIRVHRLSCT